MTDKIKLDEAASGKMVEPKQVSVEEIEEVVSKVIIAQIRSYEGKQAFVCNNDEVAEAIHALIYGDKND